MKGLLALAISLAIAFPALAAEGGNAPGGKINYREEATRFFRQIALQNRNPLIAGLAKANLQQLAAPTILQKRLVTVPLLPMQNNSLVVPALLHRKIAGTFLIDTGATHTIITPRMARKLNISITPQTPRVSMITANGYVRVPRVLLQSVTIGGLEVKHVEALVLALPHDILLGGMLGMSFFQGLDLTIESKRLVIGVPATPSLAFQKR